MKFLRSATNSELRYLRELDEPAADDDVMVRVPADALKKIAGDIRPYQQQQQQQKDPGKDESPVSSKPGKPTQVYKKIDMSSCQTSGGRTTCKATIDLPNAEVEEEGSDEAP